jgi:hypothetical protein
MLDYLANANNNPQRQRQANLDKISQPSNYREAPRKQQLAE